MWRIIIFAGLLAAATASEAKKPIIVGDPAPDFALTLLDRSTVTRDDLRGKVVLLNFWATWCGPCITELPLLDRFHQDQRARGWRVIGLAVDNDAPVQAFLAQRPVSFPVGLAGFEGVSLSRALGNSGGGLPFSVVFDAAGTAQHRKVGAIAPEDLARWAESTR